MSSDILAGEYADAVREEAEAENAHRLAQDESEERETGEYLLACQRASAEAWQRMKAGA